jgi:hypothetical protein
LRFAIDQRIAYKALDAYQMKCQTASYLIKKLTLRSYPNIILAFFGGFLIDRVLGIRASALIFCTLIFLGQLVFAVGVQMREYWMCLLGRFIFGLGGENLAVSQVHTYPHLRKRMSKDGAQSAKQRQEQCQRLLLRESFALHAGAVARKVTAWSRQTLLRAVVAC